MYSISWIWGWIKTKKTETVLVNFKATLIVPFRNEENNIANFLESIDKQNFNFANLEVLLIDDHSDDNTIETIQSINLINYKPVLLKSNELEIGKKAAITKGIKTSSNEIIVCTDADCVLGENFLSATLSLFDDEKVKLTCGPVIFKKSDSFFNKLLNMDLISMIVVGAASIKNGIPTMCNGANIAYRKSVFEEVGGYSGNENKESGDDEFLLQKVFLKYKNGIKFIKNQQAIVHTSAPENLKVFFNQRIRWASKAGHYSAFVSKILPFFIFIFYLLMLYTFAKLLIFGSWKIFAILWLSKIFIDTIFFSFVLGFFDRRYMLLMLIPAQFFHVIYIVFAGLFSLRRKYYWKGRIVN